MMSYWEPFGNIKGQKKEKKKGGCGKGGGFCLIWKRITLMWIKFHYKLKFKTIDIIHKT
jgi:hypothetical protein